MIKRNRKGVIGFLLTMAVGIALGAAALVVSSEIQKEAKVSPLKAVKKSSSPAAVEKAFGDYQRAYKEYQQAAGMGREDVQKYITAYKEAKERLELEIFRNTPGVSDMDMSKFDQPSSSSSENNTAASPNEVENATNPFGESAIVLTENDYSVTGTQGSGNPFSVSVTQSSASTVTQTGSDSSEDSSSQNSAQSSSETTANPQPAAGNSSSGNDSSTSSITGMEYYRVKSGDSLFEICQKYYGDGGMWAHILKYQIPSICSMPNLIFPGQLIALPRGFSKDRNEDSFVPAQTTENPGTNGNQPSSSYGVAAPGDESWQNRFQKDYLVSDRTLTNTNTMSVADIQSFLDKKNSCLAKPYNGSTPAKMIYDAARKYGINPQVLLARLQCEQGLISKTTATKKQLDWAVGVGCYDSGNWNQKFKGLDKQIEFAASTYRRHFDAAQNRIKNGEKITMTIDGQSVTVKNAATYSFYKYCPHFQGNKLFYDVWNGFKKSF